jgi:cysteinyl-tRNA synthetase
MRTLQLYNTLTRAKEVFEPIKAPHVGLYVCGPTVYGDAHLGHGRAYTSFDVIYRTLQHLGYKVRYVRNITDVGHLENDADEGEDKIAKKARLEQLEPMEVVQYYTNRFRANMLALNNLPPNIEPTASGHIIEQIQIIEDIIKNGFGYEVNGSVYFDVVKYNKDFPYGQLSGRNIEEMLENTRALDGQSDKRNSVDFALWKKASPEHIMHWPSPWSEGFPGWHLECTAMSTKYLGDFFDIHGGGMDLTFPHHEAEIAQSTACNHKQPVKYWIHNNMITINGQKMGKSLGNFITLEELFSGEHKALEQAYNPMTVRLFILQAHYRSTLDFSNEALQAAEKGLKRLLDSLQTLTELKASEATSNLNVQEFEEKCYAALLDDFNTPILVANLFDVVRFINSVKAGKETVSAQDLEKLQSLFTLFISDILGLKNVENESTDTASLENQLMDVLLDLRGQAKTEKNYAIADSIRNQLTAIGVVIKDSKEGASWEKN